MTLWHPALYAWASSSVFNAIAVRGLPVALVMIARFIVVAVGVGAGIALKSKRESAVTFAIASLAASAAVDVFIYTTPYYPSNRMPGETPLYVAATVLYYSAWIGYLRRSKRVRATFTFPA